MLEQAKEKASHFPLNSRLTFVHGDVTDLPFPDGYFDCIGISFAFRNLTYKNPKTERYLSEILRVLKKGGRFVIVESSQPPNSFIRKLDHLYLRTFVRWIGSWLSKNKPAYVYLTESARNFYTAEELGDLLIKTGIQQSNCETAAFRRNGNSHCNEISRKFQNQELKSQGHSSDLTGRILVPIVNPVQAGNPNSHCHSFDHPVPSRYGSGTVE